MMIHLMRLELLPVGNGLLHLPTAELMPLTPDYFNITASDVCFDPAAPKPRKQWLNFLQQIFGDDKQAIGGLQDWFGYTLVARYLTTENVDGRRADAIGKGTIARINTAVARRLSRASPRQRWRRCN